MFLRQNTTDTVWRPHLRDAGLAPTPELAHEERGGSPGTPLRSGWDATPSTHLATCCVSAPRSQGGASRHFALLDVALLNAYDQCRVGWLR